MSSGDLRFQAIMLTIAGGGTTIEAWEHPGWGHDEPIKPEGSIIAAKLRESPSRLGQST
jgi:hypothetical protein